MMIAMVEVMPGDDGITVGHVLKSEANYDQEVM